MQKIAPIFLHFSSWRALSGVGLCYLRSSRLPLAEFGLGLYPVLDVVVEGWEEIDASEALYLVDRMHGVGQMLLSPLMKASGTHTRFLPTVFCSPWP